MILHLLVQGRCPLASKTAETSFSLSPWYPIALGRDGHEVGTCWSSLTKLKRASSICTCLSLRLSSYHFFSIPGATAAPFSTFLVGFQLLSLSNGTNFLTPGTVCIPLGVFIAVAPTHNSSPPPPGFHPRRIIPASSRRWQKTRALGVAERLQRLYLDGNVPELLRVGQWGKRKGKTDVQTELSPAPVHHHKTKKQS